MEAFLDSYSRKSTMRMYRRGLQLFSEWCQKDVETILRERKDDLTPRPNESLVDAKQRANRFERRLEDFHKWTLERGYKLNSARTLCLGLMQLFRYYSMGITLRAGSPVAQTEIKTDDFILLPEHVRAMFHVAKDLRSKLLISMGNDLGWRIGDVITIQRNELPNLKQTPPIQWLRITRKERQAAKTCLSKTTTLLLKEYLANVPTKGPYLFNGNGGGHISDETVNARLRDLARDTEIEIGNADLHWHCFRKMVISMGKNLSIDPDMVDIMTGKAVKKSMLTYLAGLDVKTAFQKLQTVLGLTTLTEEGDNQMKTLESENKELRQQLEAIRNVLLTVLGVNRKELEKIVVKQLTKEGATVRGDSGNVSIEKYVSVMPIDTLYEELARIQKARPSSKFVEIEIA
jgi:integrase